MQINETWAISAERIKAFFSGQDDVIQIREDIFSCDGCRIIVTSLSPRLTGGLCFPQTKIEFIGPDPDITDIHQRFVLQFISAGG